jgi:mannose-6-phosphate isomerase-like protein (cupin superfamily)
VGFEYPMGSTNIEKEVSIMFVGNIEKIAKENTNFRKVLMTGSNAQLVVMSIPVGGEISEEVHPNTDQIILIVDGDAQAVLNGDVRMIEEEGAVFIKAGTTHNIKNTGDEILKIVTIYAPPEHPDGLVQANRDG